MSYAIYPLQFDTPVHFGQAGRGNQLAQVGMAYPADVLFSAICAELAAAHETAVLDRFAEKVRTRRCFFPISCRGSGEATAHFAFSCRVLSCVCLSMRRRRRATTARSVVYRVCGRNKRR